MKNSRRRFLTTGSAVAVFGVVQSAVGGAASAPAAGAAGYPAAAGGGPGAAVFADLFPTTSPDLAREMVGVSHNNLARVKELVGRQPALARAAWDWGFGDWESALGAASHVGQREIAEFLIENGARPDIFTAAMLGNLDAVKAFVAARAGIQTLRGPHGIPLLAHAEAGGEAARPVVAYLKELGGAGERDADVPLADTEVEALVGRYTFGPGARDAFDIKRRTGGGMPGQLVVQRVDGSPRNLFHQGNREFLPAGAAAVRLRFSPETPAATFGLFDPDLVLTARR